MIIQLTITMKNNNLDKVLKVHLVIAFLLLVSCVGIPSTVTPVNDFEIDRYLGKWYEIARLDHSFERGLEQVLSLIHI